MLPDCEAVKYQESRSATQPNLAVLPSWLEGSIPFARYPRGRHCYKEERDK